MDDQKRIKAQAAVDNGGLLVEENDESIKLHLAIDPNNPLQVFDRLNEIEIDLVKRAGNDIEKVRKAGDFIDDVRKRTKAMLLKVGIDVDEKLQTQSALKF